MVRSAWLLIAGLSLGCLVEKTIGGTEQEPPGDGVSTVATGIPETTDPTIDDATQTTTGVATESTGGEVSSTDADASSTDTSTGSSDASSESSGGSGSVDTSSDSGTSGATGG